MTQFNKLKGQKSKNLNILKNKIKKTKVIFLNLVYAALLLHSADKKINEKNVKKVAKAADKKVDESQVKALIAALEGVDIEEVIEKASMPTTATPAPTPEKKEGEEEEKEEESEEAEDEGEEEAASGMSDLFE